MNPLLKKILWAVVAAVAALALVISALTFFSNRDEPQDSATPNPDSSLTRDGMTGTIKVVASTNVWASIIEIIGGDWVEVTAIIDNVAQDPHSYEATARDQLAIQDAELVIANGGGYDEFMEQLLSATDGDRIFLELVEGEHSHTEEDHDATNAEANAGDTHGNEHIWYDLDAVLGAAEMIVEAINELRPEAFDDVNKRYDFFSKEIDNLIVRVQATREKAFEIGASVVAVEGVGNLMLTDAGFENLTPQSLSDAIEEERDVPLTAAEEAKTLIENKLVVLLVTNTQIEDAVSADLVKIAESVGTPVVALSELIPSENVDYLEWMASVIDRLQQAFY